jgi:hypothetical protein
MTSNSHDTNSSRGNDGEREESFTSSAPVIAKIDTKSGDIAVSVGEGSEVKVTLRASSSRFEYLLEDANIRFNAESNELDIRTLPKDGVGRGKDGKKKRAWLDFGSSDLDVFVVLPKGSSLGIKTVSGDVALEGSFDEIKLSTVSGDIRIDKLRSRAEPRGPWEHSTSDEHAHVLRKGNTELRFGKLPSTPDE